MANKQPTKKKRVVKDPETFRERASKASDASDKPKGSARLKVTGGRIISPVSRPVGQAKRTVGSFKPLKPFFKVLSIFGKIIFPVYFRNSWRELRQVAWPNWRESRRLTSAVLLFAIVFGALIAGVDYGLDKLFRNILLK